MGDASTTDATVSDVTWEPPGPGSWALDRSHFPGGTTPIASWLMSAAMPAGMERVLGELGAPIRSVDAAFVNGFMYTRRRPLIRPDKPATSLPPIPVLKAVSRAHPEFRRRARRARRSLEDRPSRDVVADWEQRRRPMLVDLNLSLQAVDPDELSDGELDEFVGQLLDHALVGAELHFWLHGHDLGPIAQFLSRCDEWGVDAERAVEALAGASPSTSRPAARLVELRSIIDGADTVPVTLDDVRTVSPEARALLDEHLRFHGQVLATGYDITAATLAELPDILLDSILRATPPDAGDHIAAASDLRATVPPADHEEFDRLLDDARAVMDMRDDNGPLTVEWPLGLLRRALLAAGRRMVDTGEWPDAELALELTPDEARAVCTANERPDSAELERRREERRVNAALVPPESLGDPEPEPPLDVLPAPLPELVKMIETAFRHLGMDVDPVEDSTTDGLAGVGVGSTNHVGTARVVDSATEALDVLEPGDVLVVRATSPAFNVVLGVAGAVVTADGGAMSHAAVLARELGIPAVIGAPAALTIPNGATVEVDGAAGRVAVV